MTGEKCLAEVVRRVDTTTLAREMGALFRAEIAAYRGLPDAVAGEIVEVSRHNIELFFTTLLEDRAPTEAELAPFRDSARRRAHEGLPLGDLLHAYRLGGRQGWKALVDAATADERTALVPSVALLMEYVDRVSDEVTATYHVERRHIASEEERRLKELFAHIVDGGPIDAEASALAERLGMPIAESYRPFAGCLPGAEPHVHAQAATDLRDRGVLAVAEGDRIAGVAPEDTGTGDPLADTDGLLVAIGDPAPRARLSAAVDEMRLLLDLGRRMGLGGRITPDICLPELLLARSPHLADAVRRRALRPLEDYAERRSSDLLETAEAFVDCQLDRRRTAERLHVHPNTLDYRLRRIEQLNGLRFGEPDDLMLMLLALKGRALEPAQGGRRPAGASPTA